MEYLNSYLLYFSTIFLSVLFAWLSHALSLQRRRPRRPNLVFWMLSFLCLWFIMGFRLEIGVDNFTYRLMFEEIATRGFWGYYEAGFWTEPGYVLLLHLVNLFYGDFTGVFVCSSFIGLALVYSAIAFEFDNAHPALCVFVFATTQYFFYFGIDRLFLAVAIFCYGIRFVILGKRTRYFLLVLVAACFHISALFMTIIPFLYGYVNKKRTLLPRKSSPARLDLKLWRYFLMLCLLPLSMYILTYVIPYLPAKYQNYGQLVDLSSRIPSVLLRMPVVFFIFLALRRTTMACPHSIIYSILYITSLFIQVFAGMIGLGRLSWYFWISLCFVFPIGIKNVSDKYYIKIPFFIFIISFCFGYLWYSYLNSEASRFQYMFPYRNRFFEFY